MEPDRQRPTRWPVLLLATVSVTCLVAAANSWYVGRSFAAGDASAAAGLVDRMGFWLTWAALAALAALVAWVVGGGSVDHEAAGAPPAPDGGQGASGATAAGSAGGGLATIQRTHAPGAAGPPGHGDVGGLDPRRPQAPRPWHWTDAARWVLAGGWVAVLAVALLLGTRSAGYEQVRAGAQAGSVHEVTVAGGLAEGEGFATQQVQWREGWTRYSADVVWATDGVTFGNTGSDGAVTAVLRHDVADDLTALAPRLVVHREAQLPASSVHFFGRDLPAPQVLGPVLLAGVLLTLFLVMNVPPPWRMTRWAWFWVGFTPVGAVVFALLAGPAPGLPAPRRPDRRVGGLVAFVVSLVLAPLLYSGTT